MHQSIPSTNIPPGLTPGEFFKVVKFPAPGQKIFAKLRPGAKNRQKPRPWGQFCGPSRQFCHDRETIRIFLVLFFSLAFFEFFQRLIIKLANTKFLSDSSIAQLRFDMYRKNQCLLAIRSIIIKYVYKVGFYDNSIYVMVKHRNKRFRESNVPNDLIPDEIAIKTSPIDFL